MNIFEDEEDNHQFINTLDRMRVRYDDDGKPCGTNCIYYAYCLMGNHFHLLIRERDERVGETVKRIEAHMCITITGNMVVMDTCSKSVSKVSQSTTWPILQCC